VTAFTGHGENHENSETLKPIDGKPRLALITKLNILKMTTRHNQLDKRQSS